MSRAFCLKCRTLLESKTRHDLAQCGCDNQSFIDGGSDYIRMGGVDMDAILILQPEELAGAIVGRPVAWIPQGLCDAVLRGLKESYEAGIVDGRTKPEAASVPPSGLPVCQTEKSSFALFTTRT